MNNNGSKYLENIRRIALISLVLSIYTIVDQYPRYHGMGSLWGTFSGSRLLQISPVLWVALLDAVIIGLSYRSKKAWPLHILDGAVLALRKIPIICWLFFGIIGLVFPVLVLTSLAPDFAFILSQLWIFGHLVLLGSLFLSAVMPGTPALGIVAITALLYTLVEQIALFIPDISTQMTSLGWSEASRYYYASLFFSKSVYGTQAPLSSLHPSRYLLQSIPFLIPQLPLWAHRAWQVFLWLVLPMAASLLIVRRLKLKSGLVTAMAAIWGYLFLNQGPVYYHLLVCVIIVAFGFSANKPVRSLLIVLLASIWAGISRINWFPVPGVLAVLFYLLEVPRAGTGFWKYWLWPVVWVFSGVSAAFLTETTYIAISGNPAENFGTSFTSSLLWYRLFPNITYPNGVLLSILLAVFPVLILLLVKLGRTDGKIHRERLLLLNAILIVFFAGGIVVSVKIGGGTNLHNMDAFLVFLLIAAAYCYFKGFISETGTAYDRHPIHWIVTALLIIMPVSYVIQVDKNIRSFDNQPVIQDLEKLQDIIDATPVENGQVLFISQRHYITFNYVRGVTLVPDYEKVFLMEMAMADNQVYLGQFEQDLKSHRFALIVSEPLYMVVQDEEDDYFEENNAWTTRVTALIRKYYQESVRLPAALIVVSEPIP
jgi:hypothetical protein